MSFKSSPIVHSASSKQNSNSYQDFNNKNGNTLSNQMQNMSLYNNNNAIDNTPQSPTKQLHQNQFAQFKNRPSVQNSSAVALKQQQQKQSSLSSAVLSKGEPNNIKSIAQHRNLPRTRQNSNAAPIDDMVKKQLGIGASQQQEEKQPQFATLTASQAEVVIHNNITIPIAKEGDRVITYTYYNHLGQKQTILYSAEKVIGNGSFGVVFLAKFMETGEPVAIKKVLQDKRFKNRELQIMKLLKHRNVVEMRHCFYTNGNTQDEVYLNLILEYVPDTVFRFCTQFCKNNEYMPIIYAKLFTFQLCRALNYLHSTAICHRDIKPQNLLIDPVTGLLKLCDFGSAKQLIKGEPNVSYICSRYYRAPELIFGATNYTTAIDIWSMGCVLGEMLIGQPLFPGESSVDQLVEILRVMGTPTREDIEAMSKNYSEFKFPQVKPHPWAKVFADRKPVAPPEALDLLQKFLQYNPKKRVKPLDALAHPFFDELRDAKTRLPNGKPLPVLFDFTADELKHLSSPDLKFKIIPPHLLKKDESVM